MRITIFSIGTQGDVRPFVALGRGLQRAVSVRIASGNTCEPLITGHGLEFAPLNADFLDIMARDPGRCNGGSTRWHCSPRRGVNSVPWRLGGRSRGGRPRRMQTCCWATVWWRRWHPLSGAAGAAGGGDPPAADHPLPGYPADDAAAAGAAPPGAVNRLLFHFCRLLTWQMLSPAYAGVRRELGLPAFPRRGPPTASGARARSCSTVSAPCWCRPRVTGRHRCG
ncbi:glycosyltransferase [Microbulbifer halophilus]|uniref:glycosyltransferase n=1 Tax=Microbulbifer halophilus TaxID=453963 RepID=UPI00360E1E8C